MSYRFAAYSLPHLAVDPHVAIRDQLPVDGWSFEDQRERYRSSINLGIPSAQSELLDSIFYVNPDNHNSDIGSIVHVFREGVLDSANRPTPVLSYLLDRRPDRVEEQATETTELQGSHILSVFDYARVRAWDYPALPSIEIDWQYGADSILDNGDFESGPVLNEIQRIWIDEDVDGGTWEATFKGDTATGLAWDINQGDLQTALQAAFTTVISLSVGGSGTEESPFLVEFTDPEGLNEPQLTVDGSGLANGGVHSDTNQQGGLPGMGNWTPSTLLTTGQLHGRLASDGFRLDDFVAHSGTWSLRINGLEQFAGAQQVVRVIPGMRYRASIWLYVENVVDLFRLVIRDRFEALIAFSSPFEQTGILNDWKEFTCEFIAPSWTDLLVFRFAYVGTGNPVPFWIDDAVLSPGAPASTMGEIWLELMADIQLDHAGDPRSTFLTWITPTFTAALDSAGNAWPGDHKLTINEGNTYLQLMEHHHNQYGYEFDLWYSQDDAEWYFDIFNPGALGTSYPVNFPALVVGGGVTGGEAVRSAPSATEVFVRGSAGLWYEGAKADTRFAWGQREQFISAQDAHDLFDLTQIHNRELERLELDMIGLQYKVTDQAQSIPMLHYRAADYITVTPGSDTAIGSGTRRVETVKVSGRGGVVNDIDVHVQNEVFGSLGLAAQAEAVRRLLRKMTFVQPDTGGGLPFVVGGGGIPDVVIAPFNCLFPDTADVTCQGFDDEAALQEAFAMLPSNGPGWVHVLSGDMFVGAATFIGRAGEVKFTGAGQGVTVIHLEAGFSDEAVLWHGGSVDSPNTVDMMTVEDISIDGNKAGGTTVLRGLLASSLGSAIPYHLTRVELYNSPSCGLGSAVSSVARSANTWRITDCHFHDNDSHGAGIMGSSSFIQNTRIMSNGGAGIHADFGGMHIITGCEVAFNGGHGMDGQSLTGRASWIVTGSWFHNNGGGGIINGGLSDPIVVVGNYITDNVGQSIFGVVGSITAPNYIAGNGTDEPTPNAGVTPQVVTFSAAMELFVTAGTLRFVSPRAGTILGVQAAVGVSPTGADAIVDVHKNAVTIFTTQANRPTITDGGNISASEVPDVVDIAIGDYFTIDIDQVGSTTPGNDLSVMLNLVWD
jgi:hypothetical protein